MEHPPPPATVTLATLTSRASGAIPEFIVDLDDEGNGYLEARTTDHKNSVIQSSHGAVLILVAPVRGLYERSCGHAFIASAAAVGFDLRAGHRGPMLPRLNAFNDFTTEAVGSAEVSKWLCLPGRTGHRRGVCTGPDVPRP